MSKLSIERCRAVCATDPWPSDRPSDRLIHRPTNPPTHRPTNPPTDPLTDHPTHWPNNSPTDPPTRRLTDRPTDQSTNQAHGHRCLCNLWPWARCSHRLQGHSMQPVYEAVRAALHPSGLSFSLTAMAFFLLLLHCQRVIFKGKDLICAAVCVCVFKVIKNVSKFSVFILQFDSVGSGLFCCCFFRSPLSDADCAPDNYQVLSSFKDMGQNCPRGRVEVPPTPPEQTWPAWSRSCPPRCRQPDAGL